MVSYRSSDLVCPGCAGDLFEVVSDGEMTNFLCLACFRCWHVELGMMGEVNPGTCPGCHFQSQCRARRRASVS